MSTRAVTIDAPPGAVWPWLVQMGSGRGGAYTYDWIENLFGLHMHSAREILPQFQDLKVGDELPLGPGRPVMRVEVCDPERTLTVRFADGNWVWIFALVAEGGRTRLISQEPDRDAGSGAARPRVHHAGHGARQPGDGTQDAARHQAARRRPRPRGPQA